MENKTLIQFEEFLREVFGIILNSDQLKKFQNYIQQLRVWNRKFNLTTIEDEKEILFRHFADSLAPSSYIRKTYFAGGNLSPSIVDVGAGAGFPSIPLKIIYPSIRLTLVESKKKKCFFLENIVNAFSLENTTVINADATDRTKLSAVYGSFDIALTRALGPVGKTIEIVSPFIKESGIGLFWVTGNQLNHFAEVSDILSKENFVHVTEIGYSLPDMIQRRYVIVLRKK